MFKHFLTVSMFISSSVCGAAFGQATIEKVAPENTVFIAGVKNTTTMMERLKRTSLWSLWNDEQIRGIRDEQIKKVTEQIEQAMQELGVEKDSLVPPTGPAGMAVFPSLDPESGVPSPSFIALADYGENAEKTHALIQAALTKGEKEGDIEYEQKDISGRTVISIDMTKLQEKQRAAAAAAAADDEGADDEFEMDLGADMPVPDDVIGDFKKVHYVRDGNTLMLSNALTSITEAIDAVEGKAGKTIADRTDYQAIMSRLGDTDMYGVLLTRDLMQLQEDEMGMAQMMIPMVRAAVGHVHGYGLGMRLDGPTAMVEQNFFVHMPNGKAGLTTLVDGNSPRASLPSFVSPETLTYATVNFEFNNLMDVVRNIINSNELLKAQAGEQLEMVDEGMRQVLATLGNTLHFATTATKPLNETSQKTVFALQCTNPQEFENLFGGWASQIGLESRDFLGQRIFSMKPEMMPMMAPGMEMSEPMSLGLGGGYLLIGPTPGVEQALRASSQTGAPSLSTDPAFQRAVAALSSEPCVGWGFSQTVDSLEATIRMQKAASMRSIEEIKEFDAEMAAEMQKELEAQYKVIDAFDFDMLRKYIGPGVWQVRSTDDGFVGSSYMLSAQPGAGQ